MHKIAIEMLADLPNHLLFKVLRLIDDESLLALARSSRALLDIIHRDEDQPIWGPRCAAYGITSPHGWAGSYKHLYLGLLRHFGYLLRQPPPGALPSGTLLRDSSHVAHAEVTACHAELGELGLDGGGSSTRSGGSGETVVAEEVEAEAGRGGSRLWYAHDAPFGALVVAVAEPPSIVLYSVLVHRVNGPVRGLPFLRISLAPALQPAPASSAGEAGGPSAVDEDEPVVGAATHRLPHGGDEASSVSTAPVFKCCIFVAVNIGIGVDDACFGEKTGHVASARLAQLQPLESPWLIFRCGNGCRHMDFEPLLRHAGGSVPPFFILPDLAHPPGWQPGSLGSVPPPAAALPEISEEYAQRLLRNHILHHTKYVYGDRPPGRQLYGGMPRPEGVDPEDLLYRPLEVGSGHPLAGLWRGTYGVHGMEIINFKVESRRGGLAGLDASGSTTAAGAAAQLLLGYKVTGDSNVPAGQVSVAVDLSSAQPQPPGGRPFVLPADCVSTADIEDGALTVCTIYSGRGHIAETDFKHDAWVPIEVLVMQPHCIGVIWRELNTFSLFSRMPL